MSFTIHFRGGPLDAEVRAWRDAPPEIRVPYFSEVESGAYVYRRRRPDLHPASFKARHDGSHWLYDWEHTPAVERAQAQLVLPEPYRLAGLGVRDAVCHFAEALMAKLDERGTYDRRDLEWEVRPLDWDAGGLLRVEVVMEIS